MNIKLHPLVDYSGRLSPLKLVVFVWLFVPGAWVAFAYGAGDLGAEPLKEAIHQLGFWAIRFLFLALAISPARRIFQWSRLLLTRRMLGVAAFIYTAAHLVIYAAYQAFDLQKVVTEIVLRFYLAIGFVALLGLTALAVTSTDGMMRRLGGPRWQRLHQLVYPIAILAVIHFFIQAKLEVYEPMVMAGFLVWLLGCRVIFRNQRGGPVSSGSVAVLSLVAGLLTAFGEATYFWLKTGFNPLLILPTNLSLDTGIRPGVVVLAAGLLVTVLGTLRTALKRGAKLRPRSA